jgi:hypothetical protein
MSAQSGIRLQYLWIGSPWLVSFTDSIGLFRAYPPTHYSLRTYWQFINSVIPYPHIHEEATKHFLCYNFFVLILFKNRKNSTVKSGSHMYGQSLGTYSCSLDYGLGTAKTYWWEPSTDPNSPSSKQCPSERLPITQAIGQYFPNIRASVA